MVPIGLLGEVGCLRGYVPPEDRMERGEKMSRRRFLQSLIVAVLAACVLGQPDALIAQSDNGPDLIPVLIGFRNTPGASEQALVHAHGGRIKYSYRLIPSIAASLPQQAIEALQNNPSVVLVEPDVEAYALDAELDNTWGVRQIGAGTVHDAGDIGAGVKVAVIDSGVNYNHADLAANYAGGYDFFNGDADPMDDNGHGTHVAGTIAAVKNGLGVVGAAPAARIYALKVLGSNGSGDFSDVIAALQWCVTNKIQVTNNSYGSSVDPGYQVETAFKNAYAAGVLSVAAAGNSGNSLGTGDNVGYPAAYTCVIAVAASSSSNVRASFSSTGPDVELTAPGVSINSTLRSGGYGLMSGTSMASPHVAGVAALVRWADLTLTNDEVRAILQQTAKDLGAVGWDSLYGYGLVQADAAVQMALTGGPGVVPPGDDEPDPIIVASVTYTTAKKNLKIQVQLNPPVSGASVSLSLYRNSSLVAKYSGTTGTSGSVTFTRANAASGSYTSTVTNVTAPGYVWKASTPANGITK